MATERQIESNRRNAARSTGPRSESGKARSRANATKHGMAGESPAVEAGHSPEFEARRAKWSAEFSPVGEAGTWALDRAVAASLRIERCERAIDGLSSVDRERARLIWDQDRAVEAATVAARLAREPLLASREHQTTWAGVELLVESWLGLAEALDTRGDWSESDASKALDLLGIPADLRSGRTTIDVPEGSDPAAFRRALAVEEIDRLEVIRDEALAPLDEMERRQAMAGDISLLSKPARLVLRYERDAWKRYRDSIRQVQAPALPADVAAPVLKVEPAPAAERIEVRDRVVDAPARSFSEERRALLEAASAYRSEFTDLTGPMDLDDEPGWLDDLERRIDGEPPVPGRPIPGVVVPIAAGVEPPAAGPGRGRPSRSRRNEPDLPASP